MQLRDALLVGATGLCGLGVTAAADRIGPRVPPPPSHVVHERHEPGHVEGWAKREVADAHWVLPVRIGLRQSNVDAGHDLLMDISDPRSPNYGKHLTRQQVIDLFAPQNQSVEEVKRWLVSAGIHGRRLSRSPNKQWIQFDAPVQEVEELLLTKYHVFEHVEMGVQNIACSQYHIPHNVSHHIDYITPGIRLMSGGHEQKATARRALGRRYITTGKWRGKDGEGKGKGKGKGTPKPPVDPGHSNSIFAVSATCDQAVTPQCIRAQYHIPNGTRAARGNELGIFQSLGQHYNQADLDMYWKYTAPWIPNGTAPLLRSINGASGPTNVTFRAGEEADLDFEVAMPLIWPQKAVLFQTDDEWYEQDQRKASTRYPGFFNTFFDALDESYCHLSAFNQTGNCASDACRDPEYPNPNADASHGGYQGGLMCGRYRPTGVVALSYSGAEHAWPAGYMRRQCLEVLKLGLQGVTAVESSGDCGVGGTRSDSREGCLGQGRDVFAPRVLGNCPYVLSVGATALAAAAGPAAKGTGEGWEGEEEEEEEATPRLVETAAHSFASGGGFSNVFARPPWQDRHVEAYLRRANMSGLGYVTFGGLDFNNMQPEPGKLFNKAGRGYPDVAAIGQNYRVVLRGYPNSMDGTSVAVPIWASILTLINEERLAAGKSTVGFVHQVLYQHPEVFTDIVNGSNPGCGGGGFQVKKGWDPVTGLGTPIYPKLLDLFMRLP